MKYIFIITAAIVCVAFTASVDTTTTTAYRAVQQYIPTEDTIFKYAVDLVAMGERRPGTAAGDQARQYVYDAFQRFGLDDVQIVGAQSSLYQCNEYSLSVDGQNFDAYYIGYTGLKERFGEFAHDINAPMVYVGDGREKDFKKIDVNGKIVICDVWLPQVPIYLARIACKSFYNPDNQIKTFSSKVNPYGGDFMEAYKRAMDGGAVGFVGVLANYYNSCRYNNEDLTYLTDYVSPLPGLWVSNWTADSLKNIIKNQPEATAHITFSVRNTQVATGAVVGFVRGNSKETIVVQSHFDSVTPGAVEDASGCAVLMALAKCFAQAEFNNRTLMFVANDTHFTDYDTHDAVAAKFVNDTTQQHVLLNLCVEHIANEVAVDNNGNIELTGEIDPRIIFVSKNKTLVKLTAQLVEEHRLAKTIIFDANVFGEEVPTDADLYHQSGVPIINLIAGPLYLYDADDTIDKIARQELVPTAEFFADMILNVNDLDTEIFTIK